MEYKNGKIPPYDVKNFVILVLCDSRGASSKVALTKKKLAPANVFEKLLNKKR